VSRTPDFVEPFVGWKGLLADEEGGLWSPTARDTLWPVGEPLLAECRRDHEPPAKGCSCGVYAIKSFGDLRDAGYNWSQSAGGKVWVVAEVALYGNVRQGAIGWRASRAAPQKVYVPAHKLPLGVLIKNRYGVSLGIIDRFTGRRM
jgi:hypothetical protein